MKNYFITLIITLIISLTAFAQPDTLWTKTFGGNDYESGNSVQQTTDGGYIIAGTSNSFTPYSLRAVYLIKTNASGTEQWHNLFGGTTSDSYGYSVDQTTDGGYIIVGLTGGSIGLPDVWLIKTDASGNQLWSTQWGQDYFETGYSVQQTTDGGYIVAGYYGNYASVYNALLIKYDASGDVVWSQQYGGTDDDWAYDVKQTSDGGYIITGWTESYGAGCSDVWLIKTDGLGIMQWNHTYGNTGEDIGYCVQQTSDGGYIISGSVDGNYPDLYLIKTDASGVEQWSQIWGGNGEDIGEGVVETPEGDFVVVGRTSYFTAGNRDVCLRKYDASGNLLWNKTMGGGLNDYGHSLQQTTDGGYIIAGQTQSYGAGYYDVWLIRVESEIVPSLVTVTLTPQNPPIQIPAGGGSFWFNIAIANTGTSLVNADIWTMAVLPGGSEYGPIINVNYPLPAGLNANRDRMQNVPGNAPSGTYTYEAFIGVYPDTIWDDDSFEFEKLVTDNGAGFVYDWNNTGESFDNESFTETHPSSFILHPSVSPNPFNPSTVLSFELQDASFVNLAIYDITGREVVKLVDGYQTVGSHNITFDGSALSSGIYFVRLTAGDFVGIQKLLLIK